MDESIVASAWKIFTTPTFKQQRVTLIGVAPTAQSSATAQGAEGKNS